METFPNNQSGTKGRWFALARTVVLGAAISLALSQRIVTDTFDIESGVIVGAAFLLCFGALLFEMCGRYYPKISALLTQLCIAITICLIVYLTGGSASPFVSLFLPIVMLTAIRGTRAMAIQCAVICAASYGTLFGLLVLKVIPATFIITPPGGTLAHFVGLYSGLFLVAVGSSYLVNISETSLKKVEHVNRELQTIKDKHQAILQDVSRLKELEEQIEMHERMARLLSGAEKISYSSSMFKEFVGESAIMKQLFKLIERVSQTDVTTLISGESGTGKELVARAIHFGGTRSEKKFVTVNCGAIPENLIESELFGHKRGSFTGAINDHIGLFQEAEGGTLFLDEIGELPLHMQAKLLRVLQEKMVRPIGATKDLPIDVRIIAATNRTLKIEVAAGRFREDLYYRLNVISIQLPPLRERREDIPYLVEAVLKNILGEEKLPAIPPATMKLLAEYSYPGNVRELENILERAVVFGSEAILPEHLPDLMKVAGQEPTQLRYTTAPSAATEILELDSIQFPVKLDDILNGIEQKYLLSALQETEGGKKKAADLLGINFRSLRYRLQKFGIGE